jgi:ParB-like chromosome segregation protein Spo0J
MSLATTMQLEHVDIESLRPDPANPRRISDAELEALTRSVHEWGFVQPVLVRREDRAVIGGHQRLLAARRLGMKTVPVIFVDLSIEQARTLNLALNNISGEWDEELLARMLAELQPVADLSLTGFGEDELDKLLKSLDVTCASKPGDVVLDLFLGSGTTLIAAERTGRVCFGMELDAHYGSVVLARWESFSGRTAECLSKA